MSNIIFKNDQIEGFDGFYWHKDDYGAWAGPLEDWNASHKRIIERTKKRGTIIQAGGNLGLYVCILSKYFDRVITFEPDEENFEILTKNLKHHNIGNVAAFNLAVGDTVGEIGFIRFPTNNVGMHRVDDTSQNKVKIVSIDSIFGDEGDVDFIWLDIESYELPALNGAIKTINRTKPLIMMENNNHAIEVLLNSNGYRWLENSKMDSLYAPIDADDLLSP